MIEKHKISLPLEVNVTESGDKKNIKRVIILLHGFGLTGKFLFDFFKSIKRDGDYIISPNAPFPMPVKTKTGYKEGYSWYFYDPQKNHYYIDYNPAISMVGQLVSKFDDIEKVIIGYSQGGYLSTSLAPRLNNTKAVITIGASVKDQFSEDLSQIELYSIHGEHDIVVEYNKAKEKMEGLINKSKSGKFYTIDEAHKLAPKFLHKVKEILESFS